MLREQKCLKNITCCLLISLHKLQNPLIYIEYISQASPLKKAPLCDIIKIYHEEKVSATLPRGTEALGY